MRCASVDHGTTSNKIVILDDGRTPLENASGRVRTQFQVEGASGIGIADSNVDQRTSLYPTYAMLRIEFLDTILNRN